MSKTLVVNLFGAPGSGKSTGAAYIFSKLKMAGVRAELVTEFVKDKVWENSSEPINNQAYIFGEQSFRMSRCDGKVDVIVTDSPLPLSIVYNNDGRLTENFNQSVMDVFKSYNNINFMIQGVKPYDPVGRIHTQKQAEAIGRKIVGTLAQRNIYYTTVPGDKTGYDRIVKKVLKLLEQK